MRISRMKLALKAMRADPHLRHGLNIAQGQVTHAAVAQQLGHAYVPAEQLLG